MAMDLEQVVHGGQEQPAKVETPEVEGQQQPEAEGNGESTTPATTDGRHVPLAALEAERTQRQDWKNKHAQAETEARMLRERLEQYERQQPNAQQQPQQFDPATFQQQIVFDTRSAISHALVLQEVGGDEAKLNEKLDEFKAMAAQDKSLITGMQTSQMPWRYVVDKVNQARMLREIGSDPAAYRARVEAEIRAGLTPAAAPASLNLPTSLATQRSSAPRSSPAFSGPTPLGDILKR